MKTNSGFSLRRLLSRRRLLRDSRGSIAIMTAMAIFMLVGVTGMAVDGMRFFIMRSELRNLADSAAIAAGANPLNNDLAKLSEVARSYITANANRDTVGNWELDDSYDENEQIYRLTLDSELDAYFLRVIGVTMMETKVTAEVLRALPGPIEIAMALDVTRSMSGGLRPSLCPTPNEQGTLEIINTKLGALRCALRTLISELSSYVTADTRDKMRVSVIPFDVRVNVGQEQFRDAAWINWQMGNRLGWRGCIGYREKSWRRVITDPVAKKYGYVDFAPECTVPELVPLRDIWTVENRESLMYAISRFTSGPGSLLNPGLLWSWHMLSREGSAPIFNVARTKTEMENQKGRKVVVLFSDGWNNQGEMFPGANYWVLPGADRLRDTNEDMEAICTNIKNDGIEIYVVAFDNNNSVERARLARCASPGPQYFISASSAQQLIEAFRNVAVSFRPVRLTK